MIENTGRKAAIVFIILGAGHTQRQPHIYRRPHRRDAPPPAAHHHRCRIQPHQEGDLAASGREPLPRLLTGTDPHHQEVPAARQRHSIDV